ncbi:LytR C-terminal domain-containing protein [Nocardioides limicola]|uniref:LytR C-terminal domain-containing protein n=1 Tax=Nocardioides limicola TaxID=2803368 RepID=UPI00193B1126|nr:LytR C-terminal domain-containing protein [Nocardioides sp. DJM-14]
MSNAMRSAATLAVLSVLVLLAAVWGWQAVTAPVREEVVETGPPPLCVDRAVATGDRVTPDQVTVSVYNASGRAGLANSTLEALVEAGFAPGRTGNAPPGVEVRFVRIWAEDPQHPAVRLVARHLGNPVVRPNEGLDTPGVIVLVGAEFAGVEDGPASVPARFDALVCGP